MRKSSVSSSVLVIGALAFVGPPATIAEASPDTPPTASSTTNAAADGKLVVHVIVPLCDNRQIDCGSSLSGKPDELAHNLYWGAVFGQKTFFSRKGSPYARTRTEGEDGDRLERAIFTKKVAGKPWGQTAELELVVVFDAYRGDAIDHALAVFYEEAERGADLDVGHVDLIGWAGHDRMMDGTKPPKRAAPEERAPIPSFVMACYSRSYFEDPLLARGSVPIALTSSLMAPEGYVVDAVIDGFAAHESRTRIRARAISAYAKFQRIEEKAAASVFSKLDE